MERTTVPGGAQTTARHLPDEDSSAPPFEEHPMDLVTVPARHGLEAVDILRRGGEPAVGPVLHDGPGDTLGFLVPPGTAEEWDLPGSACTTAFGRGVRTDPAGEGAAYPQPDPEWEPPVDGTCWLLPPADTDPVTDPEVLRAALGEAARLIEAADRCR
ncbi:hypothetical protein [Streptomyces sp. GC420]|uniref:hypothetical protein n=1 Tax=Streptomyces sp. GC420 TaxID=2697568 RepID=UPI0028BE5CDD|nr:hypothetical protein [Streptomyces sp. GC420]